MYRKLPHPLLAGLVVLCLSAIGAGRAEAQTTSAKVNDLGLAAYIKEIVHANPTVEAGRIKWLIKKDEASSAWAPFEPTLDGSLKQNGLVQQNTALQQYQQLGTNIYDQKNRVYSLNIQGRLPTGATYKVGTSLKRLQDTYAEQGQFQAFLGVSASQPLLKGATHGAPLAGVRTAHEGRIIAFQQYRLQLMKMIQQAEIAYWNLAFAQDGRKIASDSVHVARYLLTVARQGEQVGKTSKLDVEQAQAELALQLANENNSELSVSDAETQLRLLMGQSGPATGKIVATTALVPGINLNKESGAAISKMLAWAYRAQPQYMVAREQLHKEELAFAYQKDQVLPELNLNGSYGYTGLGTTFKNSLDALGSQKYPTWTVGLEMKIPLMPGLVQHNQLKAEALKMRLAVIRLKTARNLLTRGVTNLAHDVTTLRQRIKNATTVVKVKGQLLDVEETRFKNGTANLVDVYKAENSLNQARLSELQSIVSYRKAVMQLEMVAGTVLKEQGLEKLRDHQVTLIQSLRLK